MTVIKLSDGSDVTSSVTTGSTSISSQEVTLKTIQTLTEGENYRVDLQITKDSSTPIIELFIDCVNRVGA